MEELIGRKEFDELRARVELLERAASRVVGPVLDLPPDIVADVVVAFVCPNGGNGPRKNCSCGVVH